MSNSRRDLGRPGSPRPARRSSAPAHRRRPEPTTPLRPDAVGARRPDPPGARRLRGTGTSGPAAARRRPPAPVLVRRWVVLAGVVILLAFSLKAAFGGGAPAAPAAPAGSSTSTPGRSGATAGSRTEQRFVVSEASWHLEAPVSRAVVLATGNELLVLGGLTTGDVSTADIWRLSPGTGSATRVGTLSTAVHDAAGAYLGGRALVFGGGSYSSLGEVQAAPGGSGVSTVAGSLPVPRSDLSAAVVGGHAYVLGGYNGSALVAQVLETSDGVHFTTAGTLVQPVRYAAVAALGGAIYAVGGDLGTTESAGAGGATSDIQRFDPATGRAEVIGHLPSGLGHASAVALGGRIYVIGGRSASGLLSTEIFSIDPGTGTVRSVGALAYPRSDASAAVVGGTAYLVGGETSGPLAPLTSVLEVRLETVRVRTGAAGQAATADSAAGRPRSHVAAQPNIYAADGPNMLSPVVQNMPYRIYVPESAGSDVDVIDPYTYKVVARYYTGLDPQHVIPAWNLKTIYAANDLGNSLTPISPYTGRPEGPNIPVADPYNLYFTPNGRYAIVVEEANQTLAFRDPTTMKLIKALPVDCPGVDHGDFSADGSFAIFSCEFSARMVKVNLRTLSVESYLNIPGTAPQDVKLDPAGDIFYTADLNHGGVYLISAKTFRVIGFIATGRDAHGLYVSRNARYLYVTNRGSGSISEIDLATRKVKATWYIPGGGSPDMGNLSPDGTVLWVSGRYNACVYAISTVTGKLLAEIPVPNMPHGLLVWPQPGQYSIGHTGIMR